MNEAAKTECRTEVMRLLKELSIKTTGAEVRTVDIGSFEDNCEQLIKALDLGQTKISSKTLNLRNILAQIELEVLGQNMTTYTNLPADESLYVFLMLEGSDGIIGLIGNFPSARSTRMPYWQPIIVPFDESNSMQGVQKAKRLFECYN